MTPEIEEALEQATEHSDCDKVNCFAGEDAWVCIYARALLACQERAEKAEAQTAWCRNEMRCNDVFADKRMHEIAAVAAERDQLRAEVERLKQDREDWVRSGLNETKQLRAENEKLVRVIGEHVEVRTRYHAEIEKLRAEVSAMDLNLIAKNDEIGALIEEVERLRAAHAGKGDGK